LSKKKPKEEEEAKDNAKNETEDQISARTPRQSELFDELSEDKE